MFDSQATGKVVVVDDVDDVVVELVEESGLVVVVVVVTGAQAGHFSVMLCPTALFRHISASLAVTDAVPLVSHTQNAQETVPTADLRM